MGNVLVPKHNTQEFERLIEVFKLKPVVTIYSSDDGQRVIVIRDISCPENIKQLMQESFPVNSKWPETGSS